MKIHPLVNTRPLAAHDPELSYQEQDSEGRVRTFFLTHPAGNRQARRYLMHGRRHSPKHHKPSHTGREWYIMEREAGEGTDL